MNKKRVVVAGGSGLIGRALTNELLRRDYEVVVLTRLPQEREDDVREVEWDGESPGEWTQVLEGAETVVNLAGRNINCRHTPENLREITESRVNSVRTIAAAIGHLQPPPRVWVQAGAIGFYGNGQDRWCDETAPPGADPLAEVCQLWEQAFNAAVLPQTRRALLRIGLVLDRNGGALPMLCELTRWFLGGAAGSGRQYVSWIHISDLVQMFLQAIERENFLTGTFNAVGPEPVTNAEFMRGLRRVWHRPWSPSVPEWVLRLGARVLRTEPSLALAGCRVAPKRFLETGFQFQFPELRGALKNIYR